MSSTSNPTQPPRMADWLALAHQDPEWGKHRSDTLDGARLLARVSAKFEGQTYYVTDRRAAGLGYGVESASAHRFAIQRRWPTCLLVERWDPSGEGPLTLDGRAVALDPTASGVASGRALAAPCPPSLSSAPAPSFSADEEDDPCADGHEFIPEDDGRYKCWGCGIYQPLCIACGAPADDCGCSERIAPLSSEADQQLRDLLAEQRVRDSDCVKCGQPATPDELLCASCRVAGRVMLRGVA